MPRETLAVTGGRVAYDVREVIAVLRAADLIFVNWLVPSGRARGQAVFGFSLAADPEILELSVRDESEAAAVGEAKRAVDAGDHAAAYRALRQLAEAGPPPMN